MFTFWTAQSSNTKNTDKSTSLLSSKQASYLSTETMTPIKPKAQPTEEDSFVNQVSTLLKQNNTVRALKTVKAALEVELAKGLISETTPEVFKKIIASERMSSEEIDNTITSFKKVRILLENHYQWYGYYPFGKPSVFSKIDNLLLGLRDTFEYVKQVEAGKLAQEAKAGNKSLLSSTM